MPAPERTRPAAALALGALLLSAACSLLPGPAPTPRYFAPELPGPLAAEAAARDPLLLRPVTAARHLGERIVWCDGGVEYGYYELLRWTRPPAETLTAALEQVLFESGRFERSHAPGTTMLEVSLQAFEKRLGEPPHVLLELTAVLTDASGTTLLDRRFGGTRVLSADDPADIARSLGSLMADVLAQLVAAVEECTGSPVSSPVPAAAASGG